MTNKKTGIAVGTVLLILVAVIAILIMNSVVALGAVSTISVAKADETEISLSWQALDNATGYEIYHIKSSKIKSNDVSSWGKAIETKETKITIKELSPDEEYRFAVVSFIEDKKGTKHYSKEEYPIIDASTKPKTNITEDKNSNIVSLITGEQIAEETLQSENATETSSESTSSTNANTSDSTNTSSKPQTQSSRNNNNNSESQNTYSAPAPAQSSAPSNPAPAKKDPNAGKTWKEAVTEQQWVETKAAWTEYKDIYEYHDICECGFNLSKNGVSYRNHVTPYMPDTSGHSSYKNNISVKVGSEAIPHDAEGYYKTVTIREAGWY